MLGGGSAINFGIYTVGAKDDYDAWAEIVGDDLFNWENMKERFRAIENFDTSIKNEAYRSFAAPKSEDHGRDGALKLSYAEEWEEDLPLVMDAFRQAGVKWNMDHNSGDPIGVGLAINSVHRGVRSTASDVIDDTLAKRADNLEVRTGMTVRKVVFDGDKAVGVQVGDEVCMYTQPRPVLPGPGARTRANRRSLRQQRGHPLWRLSRHAAHSYALGHWAGRPPQRIRHPRL